MRKSERKRKRQSKRLSTIERRVAKLEARGPSDQSQAFEPRMAGRPISELSGEFSRLTHNDDGLAVWGKDSSFLHDPAFVQAYRAGWDSGHPLPIDIHMEWRVHFACWAASHAKQLPGSFVECGVWTGILSLAVCNYIEFNSTGKRFYLFDTFDGIPEDQMAERERDDRRHENQLLYPDFYEVAQRNFAPFPGARLVRGKVPATLESVEIEEVCYLSIDMNIAEPEVAALEFFWDKLVTGAVVLLDDYAWLHYSLQKESMDEFASRRGVKILTAPTGQGMILKP